MLQITPQPMGLQRTPHIVLMHAVALVRPLLRLVAVQRAGGVPQTLRVARVVEEEDGAVAGVAEGVDLGLGAGVVALCADLVEEGGADDVPELEVRGAEEDGDAGGLVVEGGGDVEEGRFGDFDDLRVWDRGFGR